MSVLEALLPIASASLSPREGSTTSARRAYPVSKESAVKPVEQGPQKKTPHNREEKGNGFARVLDERLQMPEAATPASRRSPEIDDSMPADGNAGGMVLPLQGEVLPPEQVSIAFGEAADPLPATLPAKVESSPEVPVEILNDGVSQEDTLGQSQQASAIFVMSGQDAIAPSTAVPAAQSPLVAVDEPHVGQEGHAAIAVTESSRTDEAVVNDTSQVFVEEPLMPANILPVSDTETAVQMIAGTPRAEPLAQTLTGKDVEALVQQDAAQRVRDWRGLSLGPESGRMSMTPAEGAPVPALPLAHGGQLQQFADSLRQAVNQELSAVSGSSERGSNSAGSVQTGAAELMPWRAEAAGATANNTARGTLATSSFSQVLQGEVFGQPLGERVGNHAWGERLSQRVSLMLGQKISSAHIQLDPPELGAMSIRVSVHGDQASVSFHSAHAVVRDALEQSFPRLQEMLNQQGLQLADAQVSDRNASGQGGFGQSAHGAQSSAAPLDQDEMPDNMQSRVVQLASGLIDFYA